MALLLAASVFALSAVGVASMGYLLVRAGDALAEETGWGHVWPSHFPDQRRVLFTIWGGESRGSAVLDMETKE